VDFHFPEWTEMTDWQTKLRSAGYTGELELGAMVRALPREIPWEGHAKKKAQLNLNASHYNESWIVGYDGYGTIIPSASANTPEEALAKLMIEHPELWAKS
jgi:hypothetical protein